MLPRNLENSKQLEVALRNDVLIYNTLRPQFSLQRITPAESFEGKSISLHNYKSHFIKQKNKRVAKNQQNSCKSCKV